MVVFVPPITSPTADSKWVSGASATVTWDASNAPESISNGSSVVLKRAGTIVATLAKGFDLKAGCVEVAIPADLETGKDYCITLFGNSGNMSPDFEICSA